MAEVGSFEAKTYFSALLARVAKGERITITNRGIPVARLVPVESTPQRERKEIIEELKAFGRGRSLPEDMTIQDLINEGRRS
jgi:prevent-host-death family protein